MAINHDEYLERIARLGELASEAGLGAVLLTGESNIDYFSGYRHHAPWSLFARPFFAVVTADGSAALIGHTFLIPEMQRTSAITDIRSYSQSGSAALEPLIEYFSELGLGDAQLGAELGYEQRLGLSFADFCTLREELAPVDFVDASSLLWRLRTIKSPSEQALLVEAARITNCAFEACFAQMRAGVTERELARIAGETMMREGADRPGFLLFSSGVENHHVLSGKPTDRVLETGDMLWMDLSAVYRGYWSDFCRAGVVGSATQAQLDAQRSILDVNQACLQAVRPGVPISHVAQAAEAQFSRLRMNVKVGQGRIGHGIGLMSTEPPHVAHYDETIMTPNLVFTIEPRFITDDGIFNCEELVLVTEQGGEFLTSAPRELATSY